jgi:16S rRNA C1402 N4-methylase RsmH
VGKFLAISAAKESATRTFQGLRIAIHGELKEIRGALPQAFDFLTKNPAKPSIAMKSIAIGRTSR